MYFDPSISAGLIVLLTILLISLAIWTTRRHREALPGRVFKAIIALRLCVILLLAALLLNPYSIRETPDPDGYQIALLADVSESMKTRDAEASTRLERMDTLLDTESGLLSKEPFKRYQFVDDVSPLATPPAAQPGTTAIGDALNRILTEHLPRKRPLGGVLMLSDGISLRGEPVTEVAKSFRQNGIPVSVIGIGNRKAQSDQSIRFAQVPGKAAVNEPLALTVHLDSEGSIPSGSTVEFYAGDTLLETRNVESPDAIRFSHTPELTGVVNFRARLIQPTPDSNPANDAAYAVVEVIPPDSFKVLFLSNRLGYTYRFLSMQLRDSEQFQLDAIIRTGENRFFTTLAESGDESMPKGFPEDNKQLLENRVLIVDTRVLPELSEAMQAGLRDYLLNRAGGILFLGPPTAAPADLQKLLPVRDAEFAVPDRNLPLELLPEPVFADASEGVLFMQPSVYLPAGQPVIFNLSGSLGARTAVETQRGALPVLSIQAYGAGRVAYLGTESSWRWQMASDRGGEQNRIFWQYLLGWLGTGGKPRIETPIQATQQAVGQPAALDIRVRGNDFRPTSKAEVTAHIQQADGSERRVTLIPDPFETGRYTGIYQPPLAGEYRIDYRVALPDGDPISRQAYFLGTRQGLENEDTRFREIPLQDIARITGGRYVHEDDAADVLPMTLASGLPQLRENIYWTHDGIFLIVLLGCAAAEWLIRRRAGLR